MFSIIALKRLIVLYFWLGPGQADPNSFKLVYSDWQFMQYSIEKQVENASLRMCVIECLNSGSHCGSFSLNTSSVCSINVIRLPNEVQDASLVFEPEIGTGIYTKISGTTIQLNVVHFELNHALFGH